MFSKLKLTIGVLVLALVAAGLAVAGNKSGPTISVTDSSSGLTATSSTLASATSAFSSHFTAWGCGFRPNDSSYELVVRGPGQFTSGTTYWVDAYPVGSDGCGSASPSWSGSGVSGYFDVYVVHSPSGNATQAQPISNVVTIYISN